MDSGSVGSTTSKKSSSPPPPPPKPTSSSSPPAPPSEREGKKESLSFRSHSWGKGKDHGPKREPWFKNLPKGSAPVLFSELGLPSKNLLNRGFQPGQNAAVTAVTPVGVLLSTIVSKLDDLILGLVTTTVMPAPGAMVELSTGTTGAIQGKFTYSNAPPGLTTSLSGSFPMAKSGQASVTYRHQHFTVFGSSGLYSKPPVDLSMTIGGLKGDITLGAEAGYDSETGKFSKLNAGIGISQGPLNAAATYNLQTRRAVDFVLSQSVDPRLSVATQYTRTLDGSPDLITYGLVFNPDEKTTLKARFDNQGQVAGLLQHEFHPNSTIGIQAEWDTKNKGERSDPKIGLSISVMP